MKINIPEKVTKTMYVTVAVDGYAPGKISVADFDMSLCEVGSTHVLLCKTEIEIELPPNFDVTEPLVAILERRRESVVQEFSLKLKSIDQQLAEVRALPSPESDPQDQGPYHDWTPTDARAMARGQI